MYTNILHATDLTKNHYEISERAAKFAASINAKLNLIYVIEPPASLQIAQGLGFAEFDKPIKEEAQTVISTLGDALNVKPAQQFVEVGAIKHAILEKARDIGCDLIIIGSHTPSNLPAILGSTSHAIVHHAPCDVLTIRAN